MSATLLDFAVVNDWPPRSLASSTYSGCTEEEIDQLTELFVKLSAGRYGCVHVVKPDVVLADGIKKASRDGACSVRRRNEVGDWGKNFRPCGRASINLLHNRTITRR